MSLSRLLLWKSRLAWRSLTGRPGARAWLLPILGLPFAVALAASWGAAAGAIFRGPVGPASPLATPLLHGLVLAGWLFGLLATAGAAYSSLYASADLELLFSAPLPERAIFLAKFAEVAAWPLAGTLFLGLPLVLALGGAWGGGPAYLAEAVELLLAGVLGAVGLGLLLHLLVLRVVPPWRSREVGAAVGTLLGAVFYALTQLAPRVAQAPGRLPLQGWLGWAARGPWPTLWAAEALRQAAAGDAAGALAPLLGYTLLAALPLGAGLWLVPRAFLSGWAGSREAGRHRRRIVRARQAGREPAPVAAAGREAAREAGRRRGIGFLARSVARKELRTYFRDLRLWSSTIYALVIVLVGLLLPGGGLQGGGAPAPPAGLAGLAGRAASLRALARGAGAGAFLAWLLASQVGLTAFGREGRNLWILRSAPLSGSVVALGKLLAVFTVSGAPGAVVAVAEGLLAGGGAGEAALAALLGLESAAGFSAAALVAGALWARPEVEDARRSVAGLPAMLTQWAGDLLFLGALAAGLLLGYLGWVHGMVWLLAGGLLVLLGAAAGAVVLAGWIGGQAWERMGA